MPVPRLPAALAARGTALVLALLILASTVGARHSAGLDGTAAHVPVFSHGEAGYPCIRTPSLVNTPDGLLAFAGSRCGRGDGCYPTAVTRVDHQDTVMKRSRDGGKTWSALRAIYTAGCEVRDHGAAVWDAVRSQLVVVLQHKDGGRMAFIRSRDGGDTWSGATPINLGPYNNSRVSPGRGLQLRSGRLLFVAQTTSLPAAGNVVFYSDDGGNTWVRSPAVIPDCNEAQVVELSNGTLLLNARRNGRAPSGRQFATSADGGATWTTSPPRADLTAVHCMGSFLAVDGASLAGVGGGRQALLYSHPNSVTGRVNGTVWVSTDEGASFAPAFNAAPRNASSPFAYSCLAPLAADAPARASAVGATPIGLLFETGAVGCAGPSCAIAFTALPLPR